RSMRLAGAVGKLWRGGMLRSYTRNDITFNGHFSAIREYSSPPGRKGFFGNLIDNVKEEMEKNKELQKNKDELNKRMAELNDSEALKDARKKFEIVEQERLKSSEVVKQKVEKLGEEMKKMLAEIQKTEAGKKLSEAGEEALKQAKAAAEQVEKLAEKVGDTQVYKHVSNTMESVKKEVDSVADVRMYRRPDTLKKRSDNTWGEGQANKTVAPNEEALGIELHKSSKWQSGWSKFAEDNAYFNRLIDWKTQLDESDGVAARMYRGITDKISGMFSGSNEVSTVLTEIAKIDSGFDKTEWLKYCEKDIIPNILEGFIRGDLEVLEDWCYERAFVALSTVVKEYQKIGFHTADSKIIDISKVELVSGKMMEQGPVLIITFQAFMINVVKNMEGKVIEGSMDQPVRVHHVWVMCRDMEELNASTAWKLLEVHMQAGALAI
ncbi:hypothetical protein PFISCL1PPCAC_19764, partial [Pristionchus fissidentatus]